MQYRDLQDKWRGRLEQGTAGHNFDLEKLAPGKFCVLYNDFGSSGACCSDVQGIGLFEDARDFLAFIRHAELPRILDYASGDYRDIPNITDSYILNLEEELRNKVDWVVGLVDRSLRGDTISAPELYRIFEKFNEAFSLTNPVVQVLAWGRLADILASDHFEEAFEDALEEETDEDEKPATELKALLRNGQFDEANGCHLALARSFLTAQVSP